MATNMFKKYTESLTREWEVPVGTVSGDLVEHAISGQVGVALTSRGDATRSQTLPGGLTLSGIPTGGVSNKPTGATVAVDGSWLFAVTGVTDGETVSGPGTDQGTRVYRAADGTLTLNALEADAVTATTYVGIIDDGNIVGGVAPIQIGVTA